MLDQLDLWGRILGSAAIVVGAVVGYVKAVRPRLQRAEAVTDAMLGRPEIKDRSGAVIQPAQPGMPARVAELTDAVKELVQMQHRVDGVESAHRALVARVDEHDVAISELQQARVEHVVSRVESASAYSAIEAAVKATPPDDES